MNKGCENSYEGTLLHLISNLPFNIMMASVDNIKS